MGFCRDWFRIAALAVLVALAGAAMHEHARAQDGERGPVSSSCVKTTTEARYAAYAYDHVVTLENSCETAQRCEVSTDVNPTPVSVDLAKGETKSVLTYRGSPAREFTAKVECRAQ